MASASDCLVDPVVRAEPDWDHMNTALHYDTPQEAFNAAQQCGAADFEVHATRLWPMIFDGEKAEPIAIELKRFRNGQCRLDAEQRCESLGFDVVSVSTAAFVGPENRCDYLPFDHAPLSCNGMGTTRAVNRWCLLDTIDQAVSVAKAFARDEPEPGPYVIVEVLRYTIIPER